MSKLLRAPRATASEQRFRCLSCDGRFAADMLVNVPIEMFTAQIQAMRCPACGADYQQLGMGEGRRLDEDREDRQADAQAPPEARARDWWANGERGLSSEALFRVMQGVHAPGERADYPRDPDDLRRCVLLLDRVPEWRSRIQEMAALSPQWKALSVIWLELEASLLRECPNLQGAAPKTAAMMRLALDC